jgi:hypothetical protein
LAAALLWKPGQLTTIALLPNIVGMQFRFSPNDFY